MGGGRAGRRPAAGARRGRHRTNARRHWLAPGLPVAGRSAAHGGSATTASVTSLLRELDASLPARRGADRAGAGATRRRRRATARAEPSRRLARRCRRQRCPAAQAPATTPCAAPALSVRYASAARSRRCAICARRHAAWQSPAAARPRPRQDVAPATQPLPANVEASGLARTGPAAAGGARLDPRGGIALLDAQATLADCAADGRAVARRRRCGRWSKARRYGKGRLMRLTRALTPQALPALLEADFPQHLRALFDPPQPAPARVLAADHAPATGGPVFPQSPRDLQPWLVLLIALLFLLERWMASGSRHRGGAMSATAILRQALRDARLRRGLDAALLCLPWLRDCARAGMAARWRRRGAGAVRGRRPRRSRHSRCIARARLDAALAGARTRCASAPTWRTAPICCSRLTARMTGAGAPAARAPAAAHRGATAAPDLRPRWSARAIAVGTGVAALAIAAIAAVAGPPAGRRFDNVLASIGVAAGRADADAPGAAAPAHRAAGLHAPARTRRGHARRQGAAGHAPAVDAALRAATRRRRTGVPRRPPRRAGHAMATTGARSDVLARSALYRIVLHDAPPLQPATLHRLDAIADRAAATARARTRPQPEPGDAGPAQLGAGVRSQRRLRRRRQRDAAHHPGAGQRREHHLPRADA